MRSHPVFRRLLVAVIATALMPALSAGAAEEDGGLWTSAVVAKSINERLSADFTLQLRFDDDVGRLERTLLRPSLSFLLAPRQTVTAGYDAHFIDAPDNFAEQRLWQQYQVSRDFAPFAASLRIRLEERFIDHVDGVPVRVRIKAGISIPVAQSPWAFTLANEAFIGLNDTARSQPDGFHENRAFIGFGRPLAQGARAQIGYQNQFLDGRTNDRMIHQMMLGVALKIP